MALAGKPVWEITEHDVDRDRRAGQARREPNGPARVCAGVPRVLRLLEARNVVEIEAVFGGPLRDPLDWFDKRAARLLGDGGAWCRRRRVDAFFSFLHERLESARSGRVCRGAHAPGLRPF